MNAYHNLAGWLRDVRACLAELKTNPMAGSYLAQLYDLTVDVTEMFDDDEHDMYDDANLSADEVGGGDDADADELESSDGDRDVVVPGRRDRQGPRQDGARPVAGLVRKVGGPAGVEDVLPRAVPAGARRTAGGTAAVARAPARRAGKGVSRATPKLRSKKRATR